MTILKLGLEMSGIFLWDSADGEYVALHFTVK